MPWTYDQRIQRACKAFTDRSLLSEEDISVIKRPLFFGHHAFGVGFAPYAENWSRYDELKEFITSSLDGLDYTLQSNRRTVDFHLFSSDPTTLRWLIDHSGPFIINYLRLVDKACWHLKLPKPRPKTKYYGEFGWRITFKDPAWGTKSDNLEELDKLGGPTKLVVSPFRTFLYLSKLNDVLMSKLILAEQIADIEDRSSL
jgi:hypothetical protein